MKGVNTFVLLLGLGGSSEGLTGDEQATGCPCFGPTCECPACLGDCPEPVGATPCCIDGSCCIDTTCCPALETERTAENVDPCCAEEASIAETSSCLCCDGSCACPLWPCDSNATEGDRACIVNTPCCVAEASESATE